MRCIDGIVSVQDTIRNIMFSPAGEIKDLTISWLFQDIRTAKKTGTVVFARQDEIKKVYFKEGDVLFASSNKKEDRLGEFLMRKGKISQEQFDKSSEIVIRTGKQLGGALFEMGVISSHELVDQVKLQVKEIILRLFNWRDGHYIFDSSSLPLSEIIPLRISTGDLIIQGVHDLDWKVVRKSLPALNTIIRPASDPSHLFQSANLEQDQKTVFSLIDGNKSIQELCGASGIGDFNTLKSLYVLLALRMAEQGEIKTEEEKKFVREIVRETVSAKEERPAGPEPPAPMLTKEMIRDAHNNLELQDHYEVLGIGRAATTEEIKKAYFHLSKLYHPDRHFEKEMDDMKGNLEALFTRIHEAYSTLSSQQKREEYNMDLASGLNTRVAAQEREKAANREKAQIQFAEGMKHFHGSDFWGADEAFQWAIRLDPDNAEYVFYRGITLSHIPRRGDEGKEYLLKAIKMAPKKIEYYLELGNYFVRNGMKAKALSVYQSALKHDPHSSKILEAIKKIGG
jgi:tetratricopeptide (TPR) repeat protein